MTRYDYDVIIVGASIAGASTAIALAPGGYRILLLDRAVFPRHKPCGEGLMPQGVAILSELGLLDEVLARGAVRVRGMRLRSLDGVWAEADFPPGEEGVSFAVVMPRFDLDALVLRRAKTFPNVTVQEGFQVTAVLQEGPDVLGVAGHPVGLPDQREAFRAPITIGADGVHSLFHGQCALARIILPRRRFGVTGHLTGVEGLGAYVEILLHPDGEIYVAPCGEDVALVALLLEERAMRVFRGDLASRYLDFLRRAPGFGERVRAARLVHPVLAVGPLGFTVEPCYRPGLLLVGDSAGFLDPITGQGMTLALKSVKAAVPLVQEGFTTGDFGERLLVRYAVERLRLVDDLVRFTRLLLNVSRYRLIANRAIRRLSRHERLSCKLMGVVSGAVRYRDVTAQEKYSLLLG